MAYKLSAIQRRAIKKMAANNGIASSFNVAGSTAQSLYRRGLIYRHADDKSEGSTVQYELTDKGWALYRNELAPKVEVKVGKVEWSFEITSDND